ncbi:MAG: hypothetical protein GQ534_02975 [Candidatus Delongbacteria bacterium]|nr:hypothetical protein [Candidatus Delongbacteria bacterium]
MSDIRSLIKFQEDLDNCIILLHGESGIGKTYHAQEYINRFLKDVTRINMFGINNIEPYKTFNKAIYNFAEKLSNKKRSILKEASNILPLFSSILPPSLKIVSGAIVHFIKRAEVNSEKINIKKLIRIIENSNESSKILMYCDQVQNFDIESWNLLCDLIKAKKNKQWNLILLYTEHMEYNISIDSMKEKLTNLAEYSQIITKNIQRYQKKEIPNLINSILGDDLNVPKSQINILYKYTNGIPLYIEMFLKAMIGKNHIFKNNKGFWVTDIQWNSEQIITILKDLVKDWIKRIYDEIPSSKKTLELASVIGEYFKEEFIDEITQHTTNSYSLLSKIEKRFKAIRYLIDYREWVFDRTLIREYIYQTLGSKVKQMHKNIAEILIEQSPFDYHTISFHMELAGYFNEAIKYRLKGIQNSLDNGLYESTNNDLKILESKYLFIIQCSFLNEFLLLKGRILFANKKYKQAIQELIAIDQSNFTSKEKAILSRLLGKNFLKLSRQKEYIRGLNELCKAEKFFETENMLSELGDTCLDLVVAYAHMNEIEKSRNYYNKAERYFNEANDQVGLLRLNRRCVIFMHPNLSVKILKNTCQALELLRAPLQEQIMSLNNYCTQLIYSGNFKEALRIVMKSIDLSDGLNNFGMLYLLNNRLVVELITKDFLSAKKTILKTDQINSDRKVENLVLSINKNIFKAIKNDKYLLESLVYTYMNAIATGEDDYIVPAGINLALEYINNNYIDEAFELINKHKNEAFNVTQYTSNQWIYLAKKFNNKFGKNYPLIEIDNVNELQIEYNLYEENYCHITMQFWSDN